MALSFDALGRVLQHVGRLLLLRADMAAEEVALGSRQWIGWLCLALAAVALLLVALVGASAWLTLVLWERFGAATIAVLALLFAVVGALLFASLLRAVREAPAMLAQTRAALHEDYEALAAVAAPGRGDEPKA